MIQYICQITIFLLLLLFPSVVLCQPGSSPPQSQRQPTVYLLEFKESGDAQDIEKFAQQLMRLRLGQLKTYQVAEPSSDNEPACVADTQVTPNSSQQITIGSDARHYVIKAAIRVREPEKGETVAVLDYELVKCRKVGERTSLAKSNQTFPYTDMLARLNSMADAIALVLESEQAVTKISVGFRSIIGGAHASQLSQQIMARLQEAQEFEPQVISSSPPQQPYEYTLSGRTFRSNSKLLFEVEVRNRRGRPFKTTFDGPLEDQLNEPAKAAAFYKERSQMAVDYLAFVRNIADTEQPPPPNDDAAEKSLRLARELMCIPASLGCVDQASAAADLLTEVVRNKKFSTEENWALLGEALGRSGEYSRAGSAFDSAAALAQQADKKSAAAEFLKKAANALLEAKNFAAAGVAYDRWIQLSPTNVEARLGKVRTYVYKNDYVNALDFILVSLETLPDSKELKEQLGFVIDSLSSTDFESAKNVVENRKQSPGAALALSLLRGTEAVSILGKAIRFMNQGQYDLMDAELKRVEAIVRELPQQSEEAAIAVGLRGLWYREARGDYDTAIRLLQDAKQRLKNGAKPNDEDHSVEEVDTEIAKTIFKRGLARTEDALARRDWEEASGILKQVAAKPSVDFETLALLREVNHRLRKDKETRDLFQALINERKNDQDVAVNLGLVCNSYLDDLECGAKAASLLEQSAGLGVNAFTSLLRTDALTLKGDYDQALKAQQKAVEAASYPGSRSVAIAYFYGVLLQAVQQKRVTAESFKLWYDNMADVRKTSRSNVDWVFDGVLRALDANTSVDANTKKLLHDMAAAMSDRKIPLPTAPPELLGLLHR